MLSAGAFIFIKKTEVKLKDQMKTNTRIVRDLNIPLSQSDRSTKQNKKAKQKKRNVRADQTLEYMDLIDTVVPQFMNTSVCEQKEQRGKKGVKQKNQGILCTCTNDPK